MSSRTGGARAGSRTRARVLAFEGDRTRERADHLATEEPLEIRLVAGGRTRTLAVTMRTPGHDFELTAGYLHGEGVLADRRDVSSLRYCTDPGPAGLHATRRHARQHGQENNQRHDQQYNVVSVELAAHELPDLPGLDRHSFTSSACGVCGRASIESLEASGCHPLPPGSEVSPEALLHLPERLRASQGIFDSTGGLHAAGLFTAEGDLLCVREDVGRHNAVDKVIGWALLEGRLPLSAHVLLVSGRSSYEIVQKALVAGVPIVCSVSAPSSLAVDVATKFGMTLVGFLREGRFNVYAGAGRVRAAAPVGGP